MGWLVQVSLTLFAFTPSTSLALPVNAKNVRLTCTSQPTESSTAKLEIRTQHKSTVPNRIPLPEPSTNHSLQKPREREKQRKYEQRIREVEMGSFTPLVFSTSGGMSKTTTTAYKRLASLLADKHDQPYSTVMAWLRINLSFSLLRSAITCLHGARSSAGHAAREALPIDLAIHEGRVPLNTVAEKGHFVGRPPDPWPPLGRFMAAPEEGARVIKRHVTTLTSAS